MTTQLKELDQKLKLLRELARELDPFQGVSPKDQRKLKKLGIPMSDDPFRLTNHLLKELEDALETRLKLTQQTPPVKKTIH